VKTYLTYDDVNIVPKFSEVLSREDVNLSTRFTKNTTMSIPIVSSPMDTVTEYKMASEMLDRGGVGVIHRFQGIEKQAEQMKRVWRQWDSWYNIGGDEDRTDHTRVFDEWYKGVRHWNSPPTKSDYEDLHELLWFADEAKKDEDYWAKRPLCAAIGTTGDYLERAQELVKNGCNVLLIDVAHGHHKLVGDALEKIKNDISRVEVVAGNIATREGAEFLLQSGADGIRVGIGNGSLCETRIRTGVGLPQVSTLLDVVTICDDFDVPCIADGGIRNIGDVCKGLGCGADSVMLGSLLSGTKESPGQIEKIGQWPNEKLFKKYRGSASRDSKGNDKNVEGNHKVVPYKGKVHRLLSDIKDGIRSSFSYVGANNLSEYHSKVEFVRVTQAGTIEAKPHLIRD
jgi:IMP dehydrogenase